jgi:nucleotide-binding universal stress UspA family protein
MGTATLQDTRIRETAQGFEPRSTRSKARVLGPLMVATDGTVRSDAAMRAARKIAAVTGQRALVLTVHVPLPVMGPETGIAVGPKVESERRTAQLLQVLSQMERVGVTEPWPVKVTTGHPAATIARLAKTIDASMIILGLGGHGLIDRIFGDEVALQALRIGSVPILAVADDLEDLPSHALAAIDFSASSVRALELGGRLMHQGGMVTLANVVTSDDPVTVNALDRGHVREISAALNRVAANIPFADGVVCDTRVLAGDPAEELLRLAQKRNADLIITGSHGHNFLSRLMLGSVSTRLLRKSGRSILVVPPCDAPAVTDELSQRHERFAFFEWAERLEEFSRRNLWRRARLEVIDPEIGAQVAEESVPFMGASIDPSDGRVHLMFGARDGGKQHITHRIEGVTAIQVLPDRGGGTAFLRIGHGRGQTLLTLER